MPADQTAFYVDLLKKIVQTAEYKEYLEKQGSSRRFSPAKTC